MKNSAFVLLAVSLVMAGCTKKEPDYYPLSEGMRWEYDCSFMNSLGITQQGKRISRIDGKESINDKTYWKGITVWSGLHGFEPQCEYYRKNENGIYSISGTHKNQPEVLLMPLPLVIGKRWTTVVGDVSMDWVVESTETVELMNKKFERCYKISYKQNKTPNSGTYWLAPNIGEVKTHAHWANGDYRSELSIK